MRLTIVLAAAAALSANAMTRPAASLTCDLGGYKSQPGLTALVVQDQLVVAWRGERDAEVRVRYGIDNGQPLVRDLAVRKSGGAWATLGENLKPEYHVVSGVRRMSTQQADPLRAAGVELTPEVVDKNRWYAFWDAPLFIPEPPPAGRGQTSRTLGPPRTAAEIRRATASFHSSSCAVKTDGASLEITFDGLSMGIFAGALRFTAYRGTNLLRMDAVASTSEPWVAYKYAAGLSGFSTASTPRLICRDPGVNDHNYVLGGVTS
jgi:hypothetical protein